MNTETSADGVAAAWAGADVQIIGNTKAAIGAASEPADGCLLVSFLSSKFNCFWFHLFLQFLVLF